jgi:hypothetical protein
MIRYQDLMGTSEAVSGGLGRMANLRRRDAIASRVMIIGFGLRTAAGPSSRAYGDAYGVPDVAAAILTNLASRGKADAWHGGEGA